MSAASLAGGGFRSATPVEFIAVDTCGQYWSQVLKKI